MSCSGRVTTSEDEVISLAYYLLPTIHTSVHLPSQKRRQMNCTQESPSAVSVDFSAIVEYFLLLFVEQAKLVFGWQNESRQNQSRQNEQNMHEYKNTSQLLQRAFFYVVSLCPLSQLQMFLLCCKHNAYRGFFEHMQDRHTDTHMVCLGTRSPQHQLLADKPQLTKSRPVCADQAQWKTAQNEIMTILLPILDKEQCLVTIVQLVWRDVKVQRINCI